MTETLSPTHVKIAQIAVILFAAYIVYRIMKDKEPPQRG